MQQEFISTHSQPHNLQLPNGPGPVGEMGDGLYALDPENLEGWPVLNSLSRSKWPTVQSFYSHGKLLLMGEFLVLDGAQSLALPTQQGQHLRVAERMIHGQSPLLFFRALDRNRQVWFEVVMELWHFKEVHLNADYPAFEEFLQQEEFAFEVAAPTTGPRKALDLVQKLLREIRKLNPHFLRENKNIWAECLLEFPLDWGIGIRSTLITNFAAWANVGSYPLLSRTVGGAGVDVACSAAKGPILYKKAKNSPEWQLVNLRPSFLEKLFLVCLNEKKHQSFTTEDYMEMKEKIKATGKAEWDKFQELTNERVREISDLAIRCMHLESMTLQQFQEILKRHEAVISQQIGIPTIQESYFPDFPGVIKSLGNWGGDFVLVASEQGRGDVERYFHHLGYPTVIPLSEMVILSGLTDAINLD